MARGMRVKGGGLGTHSTFGKQKKKRPPAQPSDRPLARRTEAYMMTLSGIDLHSPLREQSCLRKAWLRSGAGRQGGGRTGPIQPHPGPLSTCSAPPKSTDVRHRARPRPIRRPPPPSPPSPSPSPAPRGGALPGAAWGVEGKKWGYGQSTQLDTGAARPCSWRTGPIATTCQARLPPSHHLSAAPHLLKIVFWQLSQKT
jgi:hypothetical protein